MLNQCSIPIAYTVSMLAPSTQTIEMQVSVGLASSSWSLWTGLIISRIHTTSTVLPGRTKMFISYKHLWPVSFISPQFSEDLTLVQKVGVLLGFGLSNKNTEGKHPLRWQLSNPNCCTCISNIYMPQQRPHHQVRWKSTLLLSRNRRSIPGISSRRRNPLKSPGILMLHTFIWQPMHWPDSRNNNYKQLESKKKNY